MSATSGNSETYGDSAFGAHNMAMPVFDESIQAFVITKEDCSFYMDLKGIYDREFNKIKWSDRVVKV